MKKGIHFVLSLALIGCGSGAAWADAEQTWENAKDDAASAWEKTKETAKGVGDDVSEAWDEAKSTSWEDIKS